MRSFLVSLAPEGRLMALHSRTVWYEESSGIKTFFCGTTPMVPLGGRVAPPSKVTVPLS
jgi:hypothetical protein